MSKAVLVMDMQNICVGDSHAKFFKYNNKELIAAVNKVIKDNEGNSIIYILTIMKDNLINRLAPFKAFEGTENAELANNIEVVSNYFFKKHKGDAFTNPKLKEKLDELNVDEIEIVGVDGGGCVALTALGAIKAGYKVTINTPAVGTMFHRRASKYNEKLKKLGAKFI
ncbi:cysteine hydrolase family protein [Acetivibrio mesophilus]|uniref:Cysteine hydrolase n=1 Tax=Acetivibrio mesophilus TaxID=2487273 RepID=A0A4Q0I1W5_9FIRM|nr:isochorismatase family protein [Acetivibrio mesophilus]RXE58224.1 cysteine hydrolase [Acetivibrio mesophilus]